MVTITGRFFVMHYRGSAPGFLVYREALVPRKIVDRTVHRKVYSSALLIGSTHWDLIYNALCR